MIPTTLEQFYDIVNNGTTAQLKSYGFAQWDTMNNTIQENIDRERKGESDMISIPVIEVESVEEAVTEIDRVMNGGDMTCGSSMLIDLSTRTPRPTDLLDIDEDILLFPGEWFHMIPDGFICTGLWGETYPFVRSEHSKSTRFGCLGFGIRRVIESTKP